MVSYGLDLKNIINLAPLNVNYVVLKITCVKRKSRREKKRIFYIWAAITLLFSQ